MKTPIDNKLEKEIISIVESGNLDHIKNDFSSALNKYNQAWKLIPEPKLDWEIARWISSCIYSAYFDMTDFSNAKNWAEIALQTSGSDIDTSRAINMGMVCYELGQYDESYKYFSEAYNLGQTRAFKERPKKYLDFYLNKKKIKHN